MEKPQRAARRGQNSPGGKHKRKRPEEEASGRQNKGGLTMSYFHTGIRTIIGVTLFHGPVRDGKGWVQSTKVIRPKRKRRRGKPGKV